MRSTQHHQVPGATRGSRAARAFALMATLALAACGGGSQVVSLDGTYAGSFSGTLDPDDLARKGIVEFRISGGTVNGVFITGLGRQIGFGAKDGLAGRSLRVVTHPESRCTEVSGTYREVAAPGSPPGAAFTGRLICAEFTADWQATLIGPPTVGAPAASPRFAFTVRDPLDDAIVGRAYRHSFCDPVPTSDLLCGGVVRVDLSNPLGGSQPFTFQKEVGDSLPWGLRLGPNGVLEGTPHPAALQGSPSGRTYEFRVCAVDSTRSYVCRTTHLRVVPAAAGAPSPTRAPPTPSPTPSPAPASPPPRTAVPATPTPKPAPTPTATPPAAHRFTGTVTVTASYNEPGGTFGSYRVQATAVLPVDIDVSTGARSPTRTTSISGTYSVAPTNPGCGIAVSSGSVAGSVRHYAQGTLDSARSQIRLSITTIENSSTPDLGVCFGATANIILFGPGTSGALDSAGSTYTFPLSGGQVTRTGVLAYWQSSSVSTSYTVTAQLARAP